PLHLCDEAVGGCACERGVSLSHVVPFQSRSSEAGRLGKGGGRRRAQTQPRCHPASDIEHRAGPVSGLESFGATPSRADDSAAVAGAEGYKRPRVAPKLSSPETGPARCSISVKWRHWVSLRAFRSEG